MGKRMGEALPFEVGRVSWRAALHLLTEMASVLASGPEYPANLIS